MIQLAKKNISKNSVFGFELIDHTADIGVKAYGNDLASVFENAAKGMYAIIFYESFPTIEKVGEYQISLQSSELDQLLIDWLNDLLFIFSTKQIVISSFEISIVELATGYKLEAHLFGEEISEKLLIGIREIKAVTYHMLSIEKIQRWQAQVLFDI